MENTDKPQTTEQRLIKALKFYSSNNVEVMCDEPLNTRLWRPAMGDRGKLADHVLKQIGAV